MVLYGLVDLSMNSWDFYLGFGYMKFQTTNTSVVVWFWVNSMLVFEVVFYCLDWLDWF